MKEKGTRLTPPEQTERIENTEDASTGGVREKQNTNPLPLLTAGGIHPETGKPACCGRNRKTATYCRNVPGAGTDHPGVGRCRFHAGCVPNMMKKERYESLRIGSRIQKLFDDFRNDPQPHNMLNELAMLRAVTARYIETYEPIQEALEMWARECRNQGIDIGKKPPMLPDLIVVRKIISDVGAMIERMHRIEQRGLISIGVFKQAFEQIGIVLASEIDDVEVLSRIEKQLMKISIPNMYKADALKKKKERQDRVESVTVN